MTFDDLPPDWPDRPLTDRRLVADVLDLLVSEQARHDGALLLVLCDRDARVRVPMQIDELDHRDPLTTRARMLGHAVQALAEVEPGGSLLLALARGGGLSVTADDRCWAEAARVAASSRLRLLGVHVVTPDGSRPVPKVPGATRTP